jgi:2-oxoglutarate/2-oxoacid ferredoxin oxidoreductase subunit alpha
MQLNNKSSHVLIDGSRLIIEALARAGANAFIGYPITPANLLYQYGSQRMELMLPAPDEITTLQWMSGLAINGKLPVTATSFPGFALMVESINMAYMMELPMVIILVQRLGPATGTATCGAQGDLLMLNGIISGGHPLPVLATSGFEDCWFLASKAAEIAASLRTPVILLTSKEEVMTTRSFNLANLKEVSAVAWQGYQTDCEYKSYKATNLVPDFLSVGQNKFQVRFNASTHDQEGILQHSSKEALSNTIRLEEKIKNRMVDFQHYVLDEQYGAETLVVAFGISALAARSAINQLREKHNRVSLLIPQTMLPVNDLYLSKCLEYKKVIIAEETINNQFGNLLFGHHMPASIKFIGSIGRMITPEQIIEEVCL